MSQKILIEYFLQSIPESMAIFIVITAFLKKRFNFKMILILGFTAGLAIKILRMLPMTFGFHTIIQLIIVTMLTKLAYETSILNCFFATIKTILILTIYEMISLNGIAYFTEFDMKVLITNPLTRSLLMLPQLLLLILTGILITYLQKGKVEEK